jgi:nicotinamide-nucleotide amidase
MTDDRPVEQRVIDALEATGATLATAEAATGGSIASLLTDVPGASAVFDRGFITYGYDANRTLLGVDREILDRHGAVSEASTTAMARAARDRADTTWGIGATGILGPGGGTSAKPVGTAFSAVAYAGEWGTETSGTSASAYTLEGERTGIKDRLARETLHALETAIDRRR